MPDDFNLEEEDEPTAPFWMATFSDMMTLLLTFFVMIVAMSEVEVKKFEEALSYFQGNTGLLEHESVSPTLRRHSSVKYNNRRRAQQYEQLARYLREHDLQDHVKIDLTSEGLRAVITDSVMFRSGEAQLIEPSLGILRTMAKLLSEHVASVRVAGHTDDRPIQTARFPSNWELAAGRAASVVRFMLEQPEALPPSQYAAVGYGEHRPLVANDSPQRRARNRRVEIFFEWNPWPSETSLKPELPSPAL